MPCVLVVEDQAKLLKTIGKGLESNGYDVLLTTRGDEAVVLATRATVDAVILDLMLPGLPGMTVLRQLREGGFSKPILILTALDSVEDRVQGLDEGADDYLVKPFAFAELLARLRVMLRRDPIERQSILRAADLEMNRISNRVTRGGGVLDLTTREYQLLEYLLRHKNEPVTREMIAADVWKEKTASMTNVIDVYINALRRKIERPEWPPLIHTVRGVGYVIRSAAADEPAKG